jgi:LL-diaminopimelate aminotransferase
VPKGFTSTDFCRKLLEELDIVVTPGNGFGPSGEGYFRIALTVGVDTLKKAVERLSSFVIR